ncbi:MAG: hypothetical protein ACLP5H_03410 [Desulfomonilaceae bacterium]
MRTDLKLHKTMGPGFFCLLLITWLMFAINSAKAEDPNTVTLPKVKDETLTPKLAEGDDRKRDIPLKVKDAWEKVQLRKPVWIEVENLEKWAEAPKNDVSKFVLCLNGIAFNDLPPPFLVEGWLGFQLRPTSQFRNVWKTFVEGPFTKDGAKDAGKVLVTVRHESVKVEGSSMVPIIISGLSVKIFLVSVVVALILFWYLAYKSDIIRAPGGQPKGTDKYGRPNRKLYSLGRTQMACWFFVVLISYVFIWMLTDELTSLTPSVLALIGISAATGLGSAVVDSSKWNDLENLRRTLEEQKKKDEAEAERLRSEISTLNATLSATPVPTNLEERRAAMTAKQGDLAAKETEIKQSKRKIQELKDKEEPLPSKGFINDILSDENGVSFHRFQMFGWTIALAVIFISRVYDVLSMPDFDTTLLALMGISGGTYIGFKLPAQEG